MVYDETLGRVVDIVQNAKDVVEKLGDMFKQVSLDKKVCTFVDSSKSQMCTTDPDFAAFIAKSPGLAQNRISSSYVFEEMNVVEAAHLYIGQVGYIGSNNNNINEQIDYQGFTRSEVKVRVVNQNFNVITTDFQTSNRKASTYRNGFYRLLGGPILTASIPNGPTEVYGDMFPTINQPIGPPIQFTFAVIVPFTVSIQSAASISVTSGGVTNVASRTMKFAIYPRIGIHLSGTLSVGIPIISAGVELKLIFSYSIDHIIGLYNNQIRASANKVINPMTIAISAVVKAGPYEKKWGIYSWSCPALKSSISDKSQALNLPPGFK